MREPGLLYRRILRKNDGQVVVEEKWDMKVPGCPFIRMPWYDGPDPGPVFFRQVTMTEAEFENYNITLFPSVA